MLTNHQANNDETKCTADYTIISVVHKVTTAHKLCISRDDCFLTPVDPVLTVMVQDGQSWVFPRQRHSNVHQLAVYW